MTETHEDKWCFNDFELNSVTSELTRNGEIVAIEPQSLRVLEYLVRNRARLVSRQDLIDEIWQGRAISDWAISGAIKALRLSLGDLGKDKSFVRTIHSRGYRFVADVTTKPSGRSGKETEATPIIFVRLFQNRSNSDDMGYLAEGLTEDLIISLSRYGDWRVLSYNTSRAYADAMPPPSAKVTMFIEGSIRQMGELIRINISILGADGEQQTWAESFDVTPKSLLAGHELITKRLVGALSPAQSSNQTIVRATENPAAFDHYLKGRYAYFRYDPSAFLEALEHFRKAAEFDPGFADAFAQQAYCRTTLHVFGLPGSDKTLGPAEALARQAIALNQKSALGHARLGWVLGYLGRPDETTAAFETARQCDPDSAEVYHAYGETMNRLAQPERALPLLETVFSKDSYFPPSWEFPQGHSQILLGNHAQAIKHCQSVLERVPRFIPARVQLCRALWEAGDQDAAQAMVADIKSISPKYSLAHAERMFPYPDPVQRSRMVSVLTNAGL